MAAWGKNEVEAINAPTATGEAEFNTTFRRDLFA